MRCSIITGIGCAALFAVAAPVSASSVIDFGEAEMDGGVVATAGSNSDSESINSTFSGTNSDSWSAEEEDTGVSGFSTYDADASADAGASLTVGNDTFDVDGGVSTEANTESSFVINASRPLMNSS